MYKTTKGLVLREAGYKDSSKILTVLTETEGKITVSARGARRRGSKIAAVSQLLAYSELTLFCSRGRWYLNEGNTIELFNGLRNDIFKLSLGVYFAELLEAVADEDSPNLDIMRLGLNSLYALSEDKKPEKIIKAAFETRLMCLAGYEPMLFSCDECGDTEPQEPTLDASGGVLLCRKCSAKRACKANKLCTASLAALRHIADAEDGKVFSFTLKNEALSRLSSTSENYVEEQLERRFKSLEFYTNLVIHNSGEMT